MKYLQQTAILLLGIFLVLTGCRKTYEATEYEISVYAWDQYEAGDYLESYTWFKEAVVVDSSYMDGYNGLGWSLGQLSELDSSIYYFTAGLIYKQPVDVEANIQHEIWAGLAFAHQAAGNDSLAVIYGDSLIAEISDIGISDEATWTFSHDENLNELDVQLTVAVANYNLANYGTCLEHIQNLLIALGETTTLTADTATVKGHQTIAAKLEEIRDLLAAP